MSKPTMEFPLFIEVVALSLQGAVAWCPIANPFAVVCAGFADPDGALTVADPAAVVMHRLSNDLTISVARYSKGAKRWLVFATQADFDAWRKQ